MCAMGINSYETKWPNLKLETRPKQLSGSIPLAFVLPILGDFGFSEHLGVFVQMVLDKLALAVFGC